MAFVFATSAFSSFASSSLAQIDHQPRAGYSVASPLPDATTNGPLFEKTKLALDALTLGQSSSYLLLIKSDADISVSEFTSSGISKFPLTVTDLKAIGQSCIGPISGDEGTTWVQFSWVCHVGEDYPLSKFLHFKYSPELTMTAWFEDGLIVHAIMSEVLPIPRLHKFTMDAAERMRKAN